MAYRKQKFNFSRLGKPSRASGVAQHLLKTQNTSLWVWCHPLYAAFIFMIQDGSQHSSSRPSSSQWEGSQTEGFILSMSPRNYTHPVGQNSFTGPHPPARRSRLHRGYYVLAGNPITMNTWRIAVGEQIEASATSPFVIKTWRTPTGSPPLGRKECN